MNLIKKIISLITRPFLITPRLEVSQPGEYSRGFKEVDYAYCKTYHDSFELRPGRKVMWQFEREFLTVHAKKHPPHMHLDFAGGTGRVAKLMEGYIVKRQYIVDTSSIMLEVAREHLKKAHIINADFKEGISEFDNISFDLVTAFRFFPNADPTLRAAAMGFISAKIKPGGYLILNNHRNFWSIPYTLARLTFKGGDKGMLNSEIVKLARDNGLDLVQEFSIGKLPQNEFSAIFPWSWVVWVEKKLINCCSILGYNTIFVFQKS